MRRIAGPARIEPDFYRGLRGLPAVEACASGFPIWAPRYHRVTPDRCLQRTKADLFQNRLAKGEPSIEIESRPGNAEFRQGAAHRQMGVLDELDDRQLFASRIPHAASSPSAVKLFFEQTVFEGQFGHDLLQS